MIKINNTTQKIKVRFAPSPTGIPHIGSTRTALFNFLFAKANDGEFVLRIEDTDQKRLFQGAEDAILDSLKWLGLNFDGEIIRQSERLKIYKEHVNTLLDKKIAYEKEGAIWVKLPQDQEFVWQDLVGKKNISFMGKDVEEFVILKSDGFPTYHLANVVDDHLTGITHVLRGEEWTPSTPKHLYLYQCFNWDAPFFAHLPVILGTDKSKLSKRHGAKSALDYKQEGFVKEAILNYTALLGWNPGDDREKMTLKDMIDLFKIEDINIANAIFDLTKFEWLNGIWIRSLNQEKKLKEILVDYYKNDKATLKLLKDTRTCDLVDAASTRMRSLGDFKNLVDFKRQRKLTKDEEEIASNLQLFLNKNLNQDDWKNDVLLTVMKQFSKEQNVPFKTIFFLLTGKEKGIGILELNQIFGKSFLENNLKNNG